MTDRHSGYVVALVNDIREDDARRIIVALGMVKGVVSVEPVTSDHGSHIVKMRLASELSGRLYELAGELQEGGEEMDYSKGYSSGFKDGLAEGKK